MKKFKKLLSIVLSVCIFTGLATSAAAQDAVLAFDNNVTVSQSKCYIEEGIKNKDYQVQMDLIMKEIEIKEAEYRSQYDWTYHTSYAAPKIVSRSGYPGNQPSGGVKFSYPGGSFGWSPDGGPTVSAGVNFSAPFNFVSISFGLGTAQAGGGLSYNQTVDNYTNYVKLYITKHMEVKPYIIYRTHIHTGIVEEYSRGTVSTLDSYDMSYRVV